MRNYIIYLISLLLFLSCGETKKNEEISEEQLELQTGRDDETNISSDDLEKSMEQLGDLFDIGNSDENSDNDSIEANALKMLLEMSGADSQGSEDLGSFGELLKTDAILDLLEASGVSREEMQKLINNPDRLKILAQAAMESRKFELYNEPELKGKLSKEQLTSKNTPTGVSLEEAILIVQAESGPEATMTKLNTIDSLAGTNVMEKLDLTEAGYVMRDIERKNEEPPTVEETKKIEVLKKVTGQLHSVKEANSVLADLEKTENDINSGTLKASSRYQETIQYRKKIVKVFQKDFERKAKAAKDKFQKLNPEVKNVLGEPDVLQGYDIEDITGIHSLGLGGTITVQFTDNALTDVNGPDLYIFEIGQIEPTDLEISKDGKNWIHVGKIDGGVAEVDISPFVKQGELFYYVRLTDLKMKSGLPGADVDAIAAIGAAMRLNLDSKVLFESGKSILKPEGIAALKKLAHNIAVLNKGNVIVEGHTDDVGSAETNQKLSLARAKSVSAELKKLIPSRSFRWKEKGFGESQPMVENDTDENRAKNRRVDVLILPN